MQLIACNEVFGELIERTVEVVVDPRIAFVDTNEDLAVRKMIPIERKPGAPPDQGPVGSRRGHKIIGDPHGFIEDIEEELELGVEQQEKAHTRFIKDWSEELLVTAKGCRGRAHIRQVVEHEDHALVQKCDAISKTVEALNLEPLRSADDQVDVLRHRIAPLGEVLVVAKLDLALVAFARR